MLHFSVGLTKNSASKCNVKTQEELEIMKGQIFGWFSYKDVGVMRMVFPI